ncbi:MULTISPECIES: sodium/glutamate symporter [unclassified Clostridioides]|uniref:sodium/glutamate symporter n=1 Tax=unclassified Clostridioides TaxID=2635829 RepID=UPI001D0C00CA|nr:sodium:glutamate symporter [Clostridioides sp. ES-S-0001-02]MCC0655374.1 sodium:glutamate symporter [Clostridioides sp. ES-S-0123-01]MCC0702468.1 sodium:glutamate symporter [Clostridioides sp. ES-S-0049-02]MCC0707034.1 sodium:glutamate symporter [Clostridioides sp. ES-S-0190-01]MCC0762178.1 sodium:glutamate symporter [Clostridioides sp. ES-S-0006-03]UDN56794.1 sodium:glutamate symporter [Clostridioides sp. ES-S-0010-02]UDN63613.1 sodium:glutamate symporter [Clostridioides sp. ES-W-0016-02]
MITLTFNTIQTLTLSMLFFLIGNLLKNKIKFLNNFCIPAPVIGGLLFCFLNLFLKYFHIADISVSGNLMPNFITFFFTTIGLEISINLIKKGGSVLFRYWILCGILAFCQNIIAISISKIIKLEPLLGLMCGNVSMEGGHGYSAAFGLTIESLGINGAVGVGLSAATIGLIIGGILGCPVARFLIEKYKLQPSTKADLSSLKYKKDSMRVMNKFFRNRNKIIQNNSSQKITPTIFLEQVLLIFICINTGEIISRIFYMTCNILLPSVVTCMFSAVIFRNLNDKINILELNFKLIEFLKELSLGIFLTLSLMNIDLFELSTLLPPILLIVTFQVIFIILFSIFICFKILGKDFDSAIIISGLIGHGIGATPNALANMSSLTQKYGDSPKAFLVVPLVSGFLLDAISIPCILFFINILS